MKKRLTCNEGSSNKFWEITWCDTSYTVTYGKVGTNGTTKTTNCDNPEKEAIKLANAKIRKGYVENDDNGTVGATHSDALIEVGENTLDNSLVTYLKQMCAIFSSVKDIHFEAHGKWHDGEAEEMSTYKLNRVATKCIKLESRMQEYFSYYLGECSDETCYGVAEDTAEINRQISSIINEKINSRALSLIVLNENIYGNFEYQPSSKETTYAFGDKDNYLVFICENNVLTQVVGKNKSTKPSSITQRTLSNEITNEDINNFINQLKEKGYEEFTEFESSKIKLKGNIKSSAIENK